MKSGRKNAWHGLESREEGSGCNVNEHLSRMAIGNDPNYTCEWGNGLSQCTIFLWRRALGRYVVQSFEVLKLYDLELLNGFLVGNGRHRWFTRWTVAGTNDHSIMAWKGTITTWWNKSKLLNLPLTSSHFNQTVSRYCSETSNLIQFVSIILQLLRVFFSVTKFSNYTVDLLYILFIGWHLLAPDINFIL